MTIKKNNCIIIAHRGESYDAPENTLASINLAWERNADAVEIDIRLSKDNKIVVIHDTNTKRTGKRNKSVKKQTLEELRELDVGSFKDRKWKGEKIPTLEEVMQTVPDRKKLIIEIKSDRKIIPIFKGEIENSGLQKDQVEIIGFDLTTVAKVKKIMSKHKVFWISELDYGWFKKFFRPSFEKIIKYTIDNSLDGLDVWAGDMIDKEFVEVIKSLGLKLYVWTVNEPEKAKKLLDVGVDGITTDRAYWLKQKLAFKIN